MEEKNYDIVIIGGGCAGLTAAIYARRAEKIGFGARKKCLRRSDCLFTGG